MTAFVLKACRLCSWIVKHQRAFPSITENWHRMLRTPIARSANKFERLQCDNRTGRIVPQISGKESAQSYVFKAAGLSLSRPNMLANLRSTMPGHDQYCRKPASRAVRALAPVTISRGGRGRITASTISSAALSADITEPLCTLQHKQPWTHH